jgi:GH15 family glucan-1,4-alpha-glucosidase
LARPEPAGTPARAGGEEDAVAGLIEDYAIIGDMQTAALIGMDGSAEWLCLPRFDSPACFAALLGDERNGQWMIAPTASQGPPSRRGEMSRRYRGDTLILETEWRTAGGTVRLIDFMPPRDDEAPVLVRIVEGVEGAVEMECVFRLRFGYGKVVPWVRRLDGAILAVAGPDSVWLRTPVRLTGHEMAHEASFTVRAGERVPFVMSWQQSHLAAPEPVDAGEALAATSDFWSGWVARCTYHGEYRDAVIRSLITLKALTYAPTGGIVAAPTTSLPEDLGGVRNWDYRYCWLRDATITLEALLRTGYTDEAAAWREWLGRAIAGDPGDVQIMYGVAGERRLTEWEADWLPGYEDSAPVRIGNAAVNQRQLDVYGEVVDAIALGGQAGLRFDRHTWSLVRALLLFLEQNWHQPDEGIWEVRGPRQHFVHSKVMAWVAFDRAVRLTELGQPGPTQRWRDVRDRIHAEVCEKGYDAGRGTFTQYYGSTELDAALLLIPEVGFLPPDDPRVISTVEAIQRELVRDGLVLRYSQPAATSGGPEGAPGGTGAGAGGPAAGDGRAGAGQPVVDGLSGGEGAFLACSFWLVNALHMIGLYDEAVELFERLLSLRSDVGLLSEEYDPRYNRQVGNTPQAFSHMPLILSALNLAGHSGHHCRRPAGRKRHVQP